MTELKQIYNKISKQTQNRLQEIFDSINFTFEDMYKIADNKTKNKINTYIEEWKDKGLLNGYFGMLANNIYRRTRVKNNEILELLIYGAYIEEQSKIEESEFNIFKDTVNHYYQLGQEEVNNKLPKDKKKVVSVIPDAIFLALLDTPNATGVNWKQYIDTTLQYNANQIYKQTLINIQQRKQLEIDSSEYQNIINNQIKQKINIKDNKISGSTDLELIGLNNLAKIEGIKHINNNAQVRFMAVIDGKETDMCHSLDGQLFYIDKENEFDRYYGETQKELSIQRIKCFGLVVGLNLPPISHHFHWCRSTITYQVPVEKEEKIEYNLDIPKISKEVKQVLGNTKLNNKIKKLFDKYLTKDNVIIDTNNGKAMYYSVDKDKIIINPNHKDFNKYDLSEALSHEIIHLIEKRNKLTDKIDIEDNIRKAQTQINLDSQKYINMFKDNRYADNMPLSDIFSSLTFDNIAGNIGHDYDYWYDIDNIKSELSANIMSAYLNNNTDTLKIIDSISALKNIKKEVVKKYDKYTR